MYSDETRTLRNRHAALDSVADRIASDGAAGSEAAVLVTAMVSEYPTTAQAYYACTTSDPTGVEVEGGGSLDPRDGLVYALNVGTGIPPIGSKVVACSIGGRWVFAWNDTETHDVQIDHLIDLNRFRATLCPTKHASRD